MYAGTHRNGMRGAVKVLHRHCAQEPSVTKRFRREGYIANTVGHPGVVRVLDDDVDDDGSPFLVMELLSGAPLHDRLASNGGTIGPREALLLADQLLDVLAAAHERGVVHRDIKPENLFLTADGELKVLDFGIAHFDESAEDGRSQTMAGVAMGTPAYMSPEQARGRWDLVGPQSDLWSVGATLFVALSGQFVHDEETTVETLAAAFTKPARSLATVVAGAHPVLVDLVDRALERKLCNRWADARAMQDAVRAAHVAMFAEPLPAIVSRPRVVSSTQPPAARISQGAATMAATASRAVEPIRARGAWVASALAVVGLVSSLGIIAVRARPAAQTTAKTLVHRGVSELVAATTLDPADPAAPNRVSATTTSAPPHRASLPASSGLPSSLTAARSAGPPGRPAPRPVSIYERRY